MKTPRSSFTSTACQRVDASLAALILNHGLSGSSIPAALSWAAVATCPEAVST